MGTGPFLFRKDFMPDLPPRLSIPADIPAIHAVWRASVDATHQFVDPADIALYEHMLLSLYLPQRAQWLALAWDGSVQGFIGLTGPKIDALFVHPAWHRAGVGRRLINHALTLHRQLLVDVNSQNPGAVAFYKALGFREIGRSPVDHAGKPYPLTHMARI